MFVTPSSSYGSAEPRGGSSPGGFKIAEDLGPELPQLRVDSLGSESSSPFGCSSGQCRAFIVGEMGEVVNDLKETPWIAGFKNER